ncbi:MAG: DUF2911 domain-containing protein [Flavobacteriaceae bacterium]|nr:DUF2911 domain-containing protein [Flavobacteriaceae bacterium]MCB0475710.1 DUF2911 domain-containing protein [Flavobacteriaceae bacterium]
MKNIKFLILFLAITTVSCAQKSPRKEAKGTIEGINITVDYGAPGVRGRTIWGGLVPNDQVWRAGANENTRITFDKDVMINGNNLPAGTYGFFIIPRETGDWTVIFSKKNDAWGAFSYKEEEDALRTNVTPDALDKVQEQLEYTIGKNTINMMWDKVSLSIFVAPQ